MCIACLDYLSINNLGYPIADIHSMASLPATLPFFSYASQFLPWHLINIYPTYFDPVIESRFDAFIDSPQFCAFLEYVILNLQDNSLSVIRHYMELIEDFSSLDSSSLASHIMTKIPIVSRSIERQLKYREEKFGVDDVRCQTWISLLNAIAMLYGFQGETGNLAVETTAEKRVSNTEIAGQDTLSPVITGSLQPGPNRMMQEMEIMIGGAKSTLLLKFMASSIISQFACRFPITPAHLLPTPSLIILAIVLPRVEQKIDYMSVACTRLKNKRDFLEGYCLFHLSRMLCEQDAMNRRIEGLLRQALQITEGLRQYPHVVILTCHILYELAIILLEQEEYEEANEISALLEERLATGSDGENPSGWWERQFYRRSVWVDFKANLLVNVAWLRRDSGNYERALAVAELVTSNHDKKRKLKRRLLSLLYNVKASSWYFLCRYKESEDAYRVLLRNINTLATTDEDKDIFYRWLALRRIGGRLVQQRNISGARQWLCQIDLDTPVGEDEDTRESIWALGDLFMMMGEFERAEVAFRKALLAAKVALPAESHRVSDHRLDSLAKSLSKYRPRVEQWNLVCTCFELSKLFDAACRGTRANTGPEWWREATLSCLWRKSELDKVEDEVWDNVWDEVRYEVWDILYMNYISFTSSDEHIPSYQLDPTYRELERFYKIVGEYEAAEVVFDHLKSLYT